MKNRREFLELAAAGAVFTILSTNVDAQEGQTPGRNPTNRKWAVVTAVNKAAEGKADELKKELLTTTAPTRLEPGCIVFNLYQSAEDPHVFLRFEIWTDEESLARHGEMPYVKASQARRREKKLTRVPVEGIVWKKVDE
jgi:quinol monooxygenase YgiN